MKTSIRFVALAAALVSVAACQRNSDPIAEKLDKIDQRLANIEKAMASGGGAHAPQRPQRPRPQPNEVYAVPVKGSPINGPATAKVTIVEAFDFACPFCSRVHPTVAKLQEIYGNDVRVAYKQFIIHPQSATIPALAACAANQQNKFVPMMNLIWEKGFKANRNLGKDNMIKLAQEVGLNMEKFKTDMDSDTCKKMLRDDRATMSKFGVSGTPTFFINGRWIVGAQPIDRFKALVDEELKKAEKRIADGTNPADYYKTWVMGKGKKSLTN
ncbi:MAG TPA: DsbA family protein [Kofleriaceae bacterium]|nr:DsbA family protein [Kofleriaceae bacterium]